MGRLEHLAGSAPKINLIEPPQEDGFWKRYLKRHGRAERFCKPFGIFSAAIANAITFLKTHDAGAAAVNGVYVGSFVETIAYYGYRIRTDIQEGKQEAAAEGRAYTRQDRNEMLIDLLREFGPSEVLDTFITRPFFFGAGAAFGEGGAHLGSSLADNELLSATFRGIGTAIGTFLGEAPADAVFYGWPIYYRERLRPMLPAYRQRIRKMLGKE